MVMRLHISAWVVLVVTSSVGCTDGLGNAADAGFRIDGGRDGGVDDGGGRDGGVDDGGSRDGGDVGSVACEPQRVEACSCAAGTTGTRECLPNGSHFGACDCTVFGREIYVATTGSDAAPGTIGAPKATLAGALAVVHGLVAAGLPDHGVCIWMAGGTYPITATLVLDASVSGSPGRPVVIRAQPGAPVRLTGGVTLPVAGFAPVAAGDPNFARIDSAARPNVRVFDLPAAGITNYGTLRPRGVSGSPTAALELFVDDVPMVLGRWPDADQNDAAPAQSATGASVEVYGAVTPDVTGHYVQTGTNDGVSVFERTGLVGGRQYRLYRRYFNAAGVWYRAWFLTTSPVDSYPSNTDPWWTQYDGSDSPSMLNRLAPNAGAMGEARFTDPRAVNHGYVETAAPVSASSFGYLQARPARWTTAPDAWMSGLWQNLWADFHVPMTALNTANRTLTVNTGNLFAVADGHPWYAYNLLEEVTQPGEWYLDRRPGPTLGRLYFYPTPGFDHATATVSVFDGPLLQFNGASHVEVRGLVFEDVRGTLVQMSGGAHNRLAGVTLQNAGVHGATVTGSDHGIQHALIRYVGTAGAILRGGDRRTLVAGGNFVENSELHHFARWDKSATSGILLYDMGNRASNNHLHDAPQSAIVFDGNEHIITLNDIHDTDRVVRDAAAIYGARDWGFRENLIANNYIHDVNSIFLEGEGNIHGVYLDDCLSGEIVRGNIFVNIADDAIFNNGGRDNLMTANVMVRSGGVRASTRCVGHPPNNTPGDIWNLLGRIQAMDFQHAPWASRSPSYQSLALMSNSSTDYGTGSHWLFPEGNVFSSNVGFRVPAGRWIFEEGAALVHYAARNDNRVDTVSPFLDGVGTDLTLTPAVLATPNFPAIPVSDIGIH